MLIKIWQFITVLLVGLSMGMAFCHLLQMPPRMRYDVWLWKNTQSMFQLFGPSLGIVLEGAASILSAGLLFLVRHERSKFQWILICSACMFLAHAAWWLLIFPVNQETVEWTKHSIPYNWFLYRAQWEYTHAVRAIFEIVAFSMLIISILTETPTKG